jgi:hypothetical protein
VLQRLWEQIDAMDATTAEHQQPEAAAAPDESPTVGDDLNRIHPMSRSTI